MFARTLPPRSGRNLHVCYLSNVRAVAVTLPRVVSDTAPNVSSVTRKRCPHAAGAASMFAAFSNVQAVSASPRPSRANAAPAQRARRAFCSSSNVQAVAAPTSPHGPRILLQPSPPSRANVSPTQRVQLPATEGGALRLKWKCCAAAAPAQRARRAVFSLSNVQAVAATTSPRRPQCCSKCLSRRARTLPPRRECNLHVCSPPTVSPVTRERFPNTDA